MLSYSPSHFLLPDDKTPVQAKPDWCQIDAGVLEAEVAQFFQYAQGGAGGGNGPGGLQGPVTGDALGPCPQCGAPILLQQADPPSRPAPGWTCSGICRSSTWLPARATSEAAVSMEDCNRCTHGQMQKVSLR